VEEETCGKTIKKIKYVKKNAVITFTDEEELTLSINTFAHFYLYENKTLTRTELEDIARIENLDKSKSYCVNILSKKVYTEKEIRQKLSARNVNYIDVNEIINYLVDNHFLNDSRYANIYAEEYLFKGYGENKIKNSLEDRGINEDIISTLSFDKKIEEEQALKLATSAIKKYVKNKSKKETLNNIEKTLLSRGYPSNIVYKTINNIESDMPHDEETILKTQIEKYIKARHLDLGEKGNLDKVIRHFLSKGFKYEDIKKNIKED
jgi:regulatory protein